MEPIKGEQGKDTLAVKDSIGKKDSIPVTKPVINRKSAILAGDTTGMIITVLAKPDTFIADYNRDKERLFDFNMDQQPDIKLYCSYSGSPGWGISKYSFIDVLSDSISILGFDKINNVYYFYDVDTSRFNGLTEIFYNTYLNSENTYHSDSIYSSTQSTYPTVLDMGDSLAIAGQWNHKKLTFRSSPGGNTMAQRVNDPVNNIHYYTQTIKNITYGTWPLKSVHYVGIKYKDRLGWIKINLLYEYGMVVYEYAIQR